MENGTTSPSTSTTTLTTTEVTISPVANEEVKIENSQSETEVSAPLDEVVKEEENEEVKKEEVQQA